MIGLPKTTEFNKRIPKQTFYEKLTVSSALKRSFTDQIKTIYWRNKISAATMNLAEGTYVTEVEVFEVKLNEAVLDEAVLRQMDKEIPYHILFLLEHGGKYQAWIGYKEAAGSNIQTFKVNRYYHTEWVEEDELLLKAEGLNVDAVYEGFVRQIAGDALGERTSESLRESIQKQVQREKLQKEIAALQAKIRKEKQLNRQMEMNGLLKQMKIELVILGDRQYEKE